MQFVAAVSVMNRLKKQSQNIQFVTAFCISKYVGYNIILKCNSSDQMGVKLVCQKEEEEKRTQIEGMAEQNGQRNLILSTERNKGERQRVHSADRQIALRVISLEPETAITVRTRTVIGRMTKTEHRLICKAANKHSRKKCRSGTQQDALTSAIGKVSGRNIHSYTVYQKLNLVVSIPMCLQSILGSMGSQTQLFSDFFLLSYRRHVSSWSINK